MNRVYQWSVVVCAFSFIGIAPLRADSIAPEPKSVKKAVATLEPRSNSKVKGTVTFTKVAGGIRVVAKVEGLTPGSHGFHIHEKGDCSAPDAASAGGHFNPHGKPHGAPDKDERHAGDLGNIEANAAGKGKYDKIDPHLSLAGSDSIIGRSVIVHEKTDDLKTQPTGNAGGRVACGVINAK